MSSSNSNNFAATSLFSPFRLESSFQESTASQIPVPTPLSNPTVYRSLAPKTETRSAANFDLSTPTVFHEQFGFEKPSLGAKMSMMQDSTLALSKPSISNGFQPELKLMPSYISIHTSFVARLDAAPLFGKIEETLQSPDLGITVDLQPHASKLKLKGLGIDGGAKTTFAINLYRNPSSDVVVECTRQEGCVVLFNKLYQRLFICLGDVVVRRLNENSSRKLPHFPLSLPPLPSLPCPSAIATIRSLLERARSPLLDHQLQACDSLLEVSRGDSASQLLDMALSEAEVDVLAVLCCLFKSESEDVVRSTAVLLENLLKLESAAFQEKASSQMVEPMFEILDGPMTYLNRDAKRHISAGLHILAKTRSEPFSPAQRLTLERYQTAWDPVIKANVQATLHVA